MTRLESRVKAIDELREAMSHVLRALALTLGDEVSIAGRLGVITRETAVAIIELEAET